MRAMEIRPLFDMAQPQSRHEKRRLAADCDDRLTK
jgi:hypothetical protein